MKTQFKNIYSVKNFAIMMIVVAVVFSGCKKLVEVDPPINEIIGNNIYNTNATAASVLTGIYTDMSSDFGIFNGRSSISVRMGVYADELRSVTDVSDMLSLLYRNALTNNGNQLFWSDLYAYVFRANAAIEGLTESTGLSTTVKQQLLGEARFIRAFMYFYLVNLYGDVPLLTNTDIKANSNSPRVDETKVYEQIVNDLTEARQLLNDNYVGGDIINIAADRVRPNKSVATALLSRVYLYTGQWNLAEQESTRIIDNMDYQLEDINNTFLLESKEAIWQLQPVAGGRNTADAEVFVLLQGAGSTAPGPNGDTRPVYLDSDLFNSFSDTDLRKKSWIDSITADGINYPFAFKYKAWESPQPRTEYIMVLRLAEQLLIRAEARTHQGLLTGTNSASSDLNLLRERAELEPETFIGQEDLLHKIMQERRWELFTEWGHRWFDLKRTGQLEQIMNIATPKKGGSWAPYKALLPIPVEDIQRNQSLQGHQNPGYPEI
jgi:starch-binding outer membrane protein, SusD/RagB family